MRPDVEVAVVGGGPVGSYLAARLAQDGIAVTLLEARERRPGTSRAIGLHPPGLTALARIGAADACIGRGVRVRRGRAVGGDAARGLRTLGVLHLDRHLRGPYPYVLTLPQVVTEGILDDRAAALGAAPRRGVRVRELRQEPSAVTAVCDRGDTVRAQVCVVCTGSGDDARRLTGIPARGGRYGDTYLMADAPDRTGFGADAVIFLPPSGVVESFPLPDGMRRWVVRTGRLLADAGRAALPQLIADRLGPDHAPASAGPPSAFGVERRLATRLATGRLWLAGDAAHVVSPIGGQGMNLGLLGAEAVAQALRAHLREGASLASVAASYDVRMRRIARGAIVRAAWNMRAGRPTALPAARNALVRVALSPPLAPFSARLFTMQA